MVMESLPPPAAWILQIHTIRVVGGLARVHSETSIEGIYKKQQIEVVIN